MSMSSSLQRKRRVLKPFSSPFALRVDLIQGESFLGFACRLAERNRLSRSTGVLQILGSSLATVIEERWRLDNLSVVAGIPVDTLTSTTGPMSSGFGQASTSRWWKDSKVTTVCPECLAESEYHRVAWQHVMILTCPIHLCELISTCPHCGDPLSWQRPKFNECPRGHELIRQRSSSIGDEQLSMTRHVYHRLGETVDCDDGTIDPTITCLSNKDLLLFLGKLALFIDKLNGKLNDSAKPRRSEKALRQALSIAACWPAAFHELVASIAVRGTPFISDRSFYTWLLDGFMDVIAAESTPVYLLFLQALSESASRFGDNVTFRRRSGKSDLLAVYRAASRMGICWQSVLTIAEQAKWEIVTVESDKRSTRLVKKADVDAYLEEMDSSWISVDEVAHHLFLQRIVVRELAVHGLLGEVAQVAESHRNLKKIERPAFQLFYGRMLITNVDTVSAESFAVANYFARRKKGDRYRLVDLLEAAFHGHVRCRMPTEAGKTWLFHRGDVDALEPTWKIQETRENTTLMKAA